MKAFERFEKFENLTFAEAAKQYLDEFDGKCADRQEIALRNVMPYIGDLPLIDVDDIALQEFKQKRSSERMAGTVNKELMTVTAVLNKGARVWRYIPSAPKIQRVKGPVRRAYPLNWNEQSRLFNHMDRSLRSICIFAVNTGLRRGELWQLLWSEEQEHNGIQMFIIRNTKNGHPRPVILNSLAKRQVESARGNGDRVFKERYVSGPFNKAWVKAGLPDDPLIKKGIHNLRHTFGYRLRSADVSAEDRDALLGHHNHSLTQHYAMPRIEKLYECVERITKPIDATVLR